MAGRISRRSKLIPCLLPGSLKPGRAVPAERDYILICPAAKTCRLLLVLLFVASCTILSVIHTLPCAAVCGTMRRRWIPDCTFRRRLYGRTLFHERNGCSASSRRRPKRTTAQL